LPVPGGWKNINVIKGHPHLGVFVKYYNIHHQIFINYFAIQYHCTENTPRAVLGG
jgi:hypothetical protein